MPLAMVETGLKVRLVQVHGGLGIRHRLADLGLIPGVVLSVVQGNGAGPVIIAFRDDVRLAIGRGMAHRVEVETLTA